MEMIETLAKHLIFHFYLFVVLATLYRDFITLLFALILFYT